MHTDRFLLWELRQIKWQIYPLQIAILDSYWYIPTLRDQLTDLQIPTLRAETDQVAEQLADLPPWSAIWQIPTLTVQPDQVADQPPANHNLRCIQIDSYSQSPGRPSGRSAGRSMPPWAAIWQIPTLTVQANQAADQLAGLPPTNGNLRFILTDSYSETSGRLGGRSSGRSTPNNKITQ